MGVKVDPADYDRPLSYLLPAIGAGLAAIARPRPSESPVVAPRMHGRAAFEQPGRRVSVSGSPPLTGADRPVPAVVTDSRQAQSNVWCAPGAEPHDGARDRRERDPERSSAMNLDELFERYSRSRDRLIRPLAAACLAAAA